MSHKHQSLSRVQSRREFLRDAAVAAATIASGTVALPSLLSGDPPRAAYAASSVRHPLLIAQGTGEEPYMGQWKTWILRSGHEIRPASPSAPASPRAAAELEQLKRVQLQRTEAQISAARYWDAGPATKRWTEIQLDMVRSHRPSPPRAARGLALVHLAMYDALVAAWYAKYLYGHPAPSRVDPAVTPALTLRNNPSYPSEHAVVAGAASRVLHHLFPQQGSGWFDAKAEAAAASRIWAGTDWPAAVAAGLALGRTVADKTLAHGATDGSGIRWDEKRMQ